MMRRRDQLLHAQGKSTRKIRTWVSGLEASKVSRCGGKGKKNGESFSVVGFGYEKQERGKKRREIQKGSAKPGINEENDGILSWKKIKEEQNKVEEMECARD